MGDNTYSFTISYPNTSTMYLSSSYNSINYALFDVNVFSIYGCPSTTPYYYRVTDLCYDACPAFTALDPTNATCIKCPYDCLTCDANSNCLTCAPSNFRVLNSNTKRCIPMQGYF